ncbi:MAG: regulatory iron-sulfur-containing complex subunit RicT [Planctomycetia bacterium]|nr:regulatory iron-sulfur-containing complex subunit RicT [Planctomycetia bacterium]
MTEYLVRYGTMRFQGIFAWNHTDKIMRGEYVILRTDRGLEIGEVLSEVTEKIQSFLPQDIPHGILMRRMTHDDANEYSRIHQHEAEEFQICLRCIAEQKLPMYLVDVEHLFGGERIIVYYLADGRIDFRELVKILAGEFQIRIEMRQIGVRDEAKLLADFGDCGKECCCNTYLTVMPPVSMKMAKVQKATLDPSKISGRCGRLKCCLRYEYPVYEEILKDLPPIGVYVRCEDGALGKIIGQEILQKKVLVETEDGTRRSVSKNEFTVLEKKGRSPAGAPKASPEDEIQE